METKFQSTGAAQVTTYPSLSAASLRQRHDGQRRSDQTEQGRDDWTELGPIWNAVTPIILQEIERVHMAQMMDLIETAIPDPNQQAAAKRLYQTIQRDLVRRITDRTNETAEWFRTTFAVVPRNTSNANMTDTQ